MDINKILKSDYLDILFDGRNKNYGGYELRRKYPKRVRNAAILLFGATAMLSAYPIVAGIFSKDMVKAPPVSMKICKLIEPPPIDKTPREPIQHPVIPPAPIKPTLKLTVPKIEEDEAVKPEEKLAEIPNDSVVVGLVTASGNREGFETPDIVDRTGGGKVEATEGPSIHKVVEQPPKFDGDLYAYLQAHLRYPNDAREDGKEGRAAIQFVVNEDGSISGIEVARTSGYSSLDAEAKRVVAGMPHWKPGKQQGRAVKVYFTLPITFELGY